MYLGSMLTPSSPLSLVVVAILSLFLSEVMIVVPLSVAIATPDRV